MFGLFRKKEQPFLPSFSWQDLTVLFLGLSVFIGITASTVTKFSIWFDEAFGSYLVRFDFGAIARYTGSDVHPPLYYWLLKIWTSMFGNTELGLRTMSIFFGVMTIIFVFLLARRFFGRRTAYVTLLFLVLSPFFIRYSQEARMYTLLTAEIVAATYLLLYATGSKKLWPWITYGIVVALGMLTQYFAALAWVAHWFWRYWTVRKKGEPLKATAKKFFSREWVIAYSVALLLFLPWLPFMAMQFFVVQGYGFWIGPVTTVTIPNFFTDILLFSDAMSVTSWVAVSMYIVIAVAGYSTYRLLHRLEGDERRRYALVICLSAVPITLLIAASMPPLRSAFVDRYLLPATIFLLLLFAVNIVSARSGVNRKVRVGAACLLVGLSIVGIMNQTVVGNYNRSTNTANVTRSIVESARSVNGTVPIIADSPWIFYEAVIYNQPTSPMYFVNETTQYKYGSLNMLKDDDTFKINDLDEFTAHNQKFWVISSTKNDTIKPLRPTWRTVTSVAINDYLTGKQTARATLFSVE